MNLSHAYSAPPPRDVAETVVRTALECGVTMFDTAPLYGFGANEELVGAIQEQDGGVDGVLDKVFAGMAESFSPAKAAGQQAVVVEADRQLLIAQQQIGQDDRRQDRGRHEAQGPAQQQRYLDHTEQQDK